MCAIILPSRRRFRAESRVRCACLPVVVVYEEKGRRCSQEEAQDICCSNPSPKRSVPSYTAPDAVPITVADSWIDITELDIPSTMTTEFPDESDLLHFKLYITPDEGLSRG